MRAIGLVFLLGTACIAVCQPSHDPQRFEVASVKRAERIPGFTGIPPAIRENEATIRFQSATLKGVLMRAYDLPSGQIVGPVWLDDERYEVVAKPPQGASKDQIRFMLQNLVAERFRLRSHWEEKQIAGYVLVVGDAGSKLKAAQGDGEEVNRSMSMSMDGHFSFPRTTLDSFAQHLTPMVGRPVVNMTELQGAFDIVFDCDPASLADMPPRGTAPEAGRAPSIFTAIQQLGLKLNARDVSLKRLVIDAAQKTPTSN